MSYGGITPPPKTATTGGYTGVTAPSALPATPPQQPGFAQNVYSGVKAVASDAIGAVKDAFTGAPSQDLLTKPSSAPTDTVKQLISSLTSAGDQMKSGASALFGSHQSLLGRGVGAAEAGLGAVNAAFAPINSVITYAQHVPGLGTLASGLNAVFGAIGAGGSDAAEGAINALPISQAAKDQITPVAKQAGALVAQIAAGKAGTDAFHVLADHTKTIISAVNDGIEAPKASTIPKSEGQPPGALTKFDTPEVIQAREQAAAIPSTHTIDTPERATLRQNITDEAYGNGAAVKGKRLDIVSGPPASGKSSNIVEPLAKEHGALITDSDAIKEKLPEFNGGIGAASTHLESAKLNTDVLERAFKNGDNVVYPTVGKGAASMEGIINKAHEAGYEIHLHNVDLHPDLAAQRAVERFQQSGRFVDPNYIVNEVGSRPQEIHGILKNDERITTHQQYDANVRRGERYPILEQGTVGDASAPNRQRPGGLGGSVRSSETAGGHVASKIGRSIEAKAVEAKLAKSFDKTAGYDPITLKDQAARATKLINENLDTARAIIRGEEPLPEGLRGTALITAMEEYIKKNPNADLAHELANSPLVSATSGAAQEMRLAAERTPDSATAKLQEIKDALVQKAGGETKLATKRSAIVKGIKAETTKLNLPKEDLYWAKFLDSITC